MKGRCLGAGDSLRGQPARKKPRPLGGEPGHYDAEDIRDILLERRPSVALARFPLERYQGTFTTDLFGEDDTTYFDDVEQLFTLQRQAVADMAEAHAEQAAWVEVTEHYHIPRWHYRQAAEGETGGVVINLAPSGEVEVLDGLARYEVTAGTTSATADTLLAPKPKPAYSKVLCRYIAHHKSMAVQHLLLANPRKAREVAVLLLLGASDHVPSVNLSRHDCLSTFAQADEPPASYQDVTQQAKRLAAALGLAEESEEDAGWQRLRCSRGDATTLYESLKALSDADLDRLHLLLTVLCSARATFTGWIRRTPCSTGLPATSARTCAPTGGQTPTSSRGAPARSSSRSSMRAVCQAASVIRRG